MYGGLVAPSGVLALRLVKGRRVSTFWWRLRNFPRLFAGLWRLAVARVLGIPVYYGTLKLCLFRRDGSVLDYGVVGYRVVTTAGMNFLVDAFQGITDLSLFVYHGLGTGTNGEVAGDTGLQSELSTQYVPDSTRTTGSSTEGASANIYRSVGLVQVDDDVDITEHGLFTQAATGGGTLLDRTVFTLVGMVSGDKLEATYEITFTAGS